MDRFASDEEQAEGPQGRCVAQYRACVVTLGGLEPGQEILERLTVQTVRILPGVRGSAPHRRSPATSAGRWSYPGHNPGWFYRMPPAVGGMAAGSRRDIFKSGHYGRSCPLYWFYREVNMTSYLLRFRHLSPELYNTNSYKCKLCEVNVTSNSEALLSSSLGLNR